MELLTNSFNYLIDLGPTVMIPLFIFLIALFFKVKPGKAFISAITIGIGFTGVNLVVGLLSDSLGTAAQQMVERFGFNLTVIDIGWPAAASAAFASPVAPIMIVAVLAVNLLMLALKLTKTLNIDIWNFHHFIAAAAVAYLTTGNMVIAILLGLLMEVVVLIFADKFAPIIQEFYGLEGVSLTTGSSVAYAIIGMPIAWLVSKIPGIGKIELSPEEIQKRFGIFGEPMVMGLIIGIILGLLAGYDVGSSVGLGISLAAVMVLMPRMVKLLMEGLIPISTAAQEYSNKNFAGREIYIGLDSALATGHPANISSGLLLVPITLFLAVILPGNRVLPFGDLATIPFYTAYIAASRKGNIFHTVLAGTVMMAIGLYIATDFAPAHTALVEGLGQFSTEGGQMFSSFDTGGNVLKWIVWKLSTLFAN
ncbi:PTS galactitol transporter subunit IIC [Aerococcaceae bacterium DSM 109653]|uniref:PTS galactitol transporter subunit IIC n=1 Tax=Fundicoccus ignavus TaxID=2664442 RepID=A0A844C1N2_9LACT|nr:PTS transporter subunit IIC [Fundicoccus ignavus]MRI82616.1 PTS galactitol transporter subunit IIC [Fundicoccus ignavus]